MRQLYTYYRSSAAYRVRIALHLKGFGFDSIPVHLLQDGGQQHLDAYAALNPQHLIPTWVEPGVVLTQSLAIMEYLDEAYPDTPALLPTAPLARAQVRSLALAIACDIHPLNNLRVLQYLSHTGQWSEAQKSAWIQHWIGLGFTALESTLQQYQTSGLASPHYCYGDHPTLADCCLIPQVFNAKRYACKLDDYPRTLTIAEHCKTLAAFQRAAPEQQQDYQMS